ncbi:hypothetical protein P8452_35162 [Trifolium repens]|nr:hypothetical protein P8452_35162 [Trifolium repens]
MNDTILYMWVMGEAMAQGLCLELGLAFFSSGARFRLGSKFIFKNPSPSIRVVFNFQLQSMLSQPSFSELPKLVCDHHHPPSSSIGLTTLLQ